MNKDADGNWICAEETVGPKGERVNITTIRLTESDGSGMSNSYDSTVKAAFLKGKNTVNLSDIDIRNSDMVDRFYFGTLFGRKYHSTGAIEAKRNHMELVELYG